jgi:ribosomal protein S21
MGTMAKTIISVDKNRNENNVNLLRRFSRKVRDSGIVRKVRGGRYCERTPSKLVQKRGALKKIEGRIKYEKLQKMGKLKVKTRR